MNCLSDLHTVKVGDFGIAKVLDYTDQLARTQVGTPLYMSPELCRGHPYSFKSDIWALGCVLYEMCTLQHPFVATNMASLVVRILKGVFPPLPSASGYSAHIRSALMCTLAKNPGRRLEARQLLDKLTDISTERAREGVRLHRPDVVSRHEHNMQQRRKDVERLNAKKDALVREAWQRRHQIEEQRRQEQLHAQQNQEKAKEKIKNHRIAQRERLRREQRRKLKQWKEQQLHQYRADPDRIPLEAETPRQGSGSHDSAKLHLDEENQVDEEAEIQRRRRERVAFVAAMLERHRAAEARVNLGIPGSDNENTKAKITRGMAQANTKPGKPGSNVPPRKQKKHPPVSTAAPPSQVRKNHHDRRNHTTRRISPNSVSKTRQHDQSSRAAAAAERRAALAKLKAEAKARLKKNAGQTDAVEIVIQTRDGRRLYDPSIDNVERRAPTDSEGTINATPLSLVQSRTEPPVRESTTKHTSPVSHVTKADHQRPHDALQTQRREVHHRPELSDGCSPIEPTESRVHSISPGPAARLPFQGEWEDDLPPLPPPPPRSSSLRKSDASPTTSIKSPACAGEVSTPPSQAESNRRRKALPPPHHMPTDRAKQTASHPSSGSVTSRVGLSTVQESDESPKPDTSDVAHSFQPAPTAQSERQFAILRSAESSQDPAADARAAAQAIAEDPETAQTTLKMLRALVQHIVAPTASPSTVAANTTATATRKGACDHDFGDTDTTKSKKNSTAEQHDPSSTPARNNGLDHRTVAMFATATSSDGEPSVSSPTMSTSRGSMMSQDPIMDARMARIERQLMQLNAAMHALAGQAAQPSGSASLRDQRK
eukprot:INCI3588.3.p1 GENE.INCI3588.3~~INCI3588.3.p1  ORF type:complete len:828 (+),score=132.11 INCI3588.3:74-2557(+)